MLNGSAIVAATIAMKIESPAKVGDFKYYRRLGAEREIWAMRDDSITLIGLDEIGFA